MYLKSIVLENVGPIPKLELTLPFKGERPLPTVLVGTNGSGKTTVLSFIVNALIAFKQQVFEDAEVKTNRVFRIRSGLFLRGGANFYQAKLQFQDSLSMEEWVLDRPRKTFERDVNPKPTDEGWKKVAENELNNFEVSPATQPPPLGKRPEPKLAKLFSENVVLYFPSDRFEPPDWLNVESLSAELRFPEPNIMEGFTTRRIFARSLLKPTLEWLQGLKFDQLLTETHPAPVFSSGTGKAVQLMPTRYIQQGKTSALFNTAKLVLGRILGFEESAFQIEVEGRHSRRFVATVIRDGKLAFQIPNLLGLSAGQSALFCLFCNIIRDFDLAGAQFSKPEEIRGIVLIDEADLHLHLDLQFQVLPELMKMFPKVQFIVTAHSPMFVMGMRNVFTEDGFRLVDMPSGNRVSTEAYSEFVQAFEAFRSTKTFEERLRTDVLASSKPLVLVEGKHDKEHLEIAWSKINPSQSLPFTVRAVSDNSTGKDKGGGGASRLNTMLELVCKAESIVAVGIFDNDQSGAAQFGGLKKKGFAEAGNPTLLRHASQNVNALLLPTPAGREAFDAPEIADRVLELEHYYSDAFLKNHDAAGSGIHGSTVFRIKVSKKTTLVEAARTADAAEFTRFAPLFTRLLGILGVTAHQAGATAP